MSFDTTPRRQPQVSDLISEDESKLINAAMQWIADPFPISGATDFKVIAKLWFQLTAAREREREHDKAHTIEAQADALRGLRQQMDRAAEDAKSLAAYRNSLELLLQGYVETIEGVRNLIDGLDKQGGTLSLRFVQFLEKLEAVINPSEDADQPVKPAADLDPARQKGAYVFMTRAKYDSLNQYAHRTSESETRLGLELDGLSRHCVIDGRVINAVQRAYEAVSGIQDRTSRDGAALGALCDAIGAAFKHYETAASSAHLHIHAQRKLDEIERIIATYESTSMTLRNGDALYNQIKAALK